ncbi:hypothetical protein H257_00311 [Aphanomyces astaci]|uniref:PH domain-containing protein n=1 Tax=Aphanomyces astaci TaxID=112090 RepID=W4HC07_APHAT|nr:hypothetical protein H257_00311 [Aphanomyces astaci]ETV88819.1 hypothetical protein H257_00311 [Aphanomyces astaci]RHY54857.1 hypothetical protein DYB38_013265 [Aphanomyces astaci]|eukprot:XP_009821219.1 hypothetical protein H257_00311 [Aphanomyces astaci]
MLSLHLQTKKHSCRILRAGPIMEVPLVPGVELAACKSYIDTKTKKWTLNIWKCRYWHMHNQELTVYYEKADLMKNKFVKRYTILSGAKWEDKPWGVKVETKEVGWLFGVIHSKAEWAGWLHAFIVLDHKLNPPVRRVEPRPRRFSLDSNQSTSDLRSAENSPKDHGDSPSTSPTRRVSFNGGVKVRTIPALQDEDKGDLYYTDTELDNMKKGAPAGSAMASRRRPMPVMA